MTKMAGFSMSFDTVFCPARNPALSPLPRPPLTSSQARVLAMHYGDGVHRIGRSLQQPQSSPAWIYRVDLAPTLNQPKTRYRGLRYGGR
jgi:hypothetical protein